MGLRRFRPARIFFQAVWRIGLCIALSGAAIFAVQFIRRLREAPEPFLEVFQNRPETALKAGLSSNPHNRLRFAVATMVSAEETFSTYRRFVQRISKDIGREEAFILRPSYEEVRLALMRGEVDAALVCTGIYLNAVDTKSIKLLVQPEFEEGRLYRSLLLVPANSHVQTWEDLQDKVIAFTDRESFTGCLLPSWVLAERGLTPAQYFKKIIYTGSHDRSITAVSANIVDAAAVMSLVWLSTIEKQPALEKQVKIIWQSDVFGPPAILVPKDMDDSFETALRHALLSLHEDAEGRGILGAIGIKRFVPGRPESYASAIKLYRRYQNLQSKP